jgi:hypothetical protein
LIAATLVEVAGFADAPQPTSRSATEIAAMASVTRLAPTAGRRGCRVVCCVECIELFFLGEGWWV